MIKSANQYPVHVLLSSEDKVRYRIPPYQREYSWYKGQWEELFQDLMEADGPHFLGTIITLDQTTDALAGATLEVIDGQQRLTTLSLLLASVYSTMSAHKDEFDEDDLTELVNLRRQLVGRYDGEPRLTPQTQGHNLDDYRRVLSLVGLKVEGVKRPWFTMRRVYKCYAFFVDAIERLANEQDIDVLESARRVLAAARQAILVKIEVASHADAFVLFESLNNRGMPLTPVDLIKNHLLALSEKYGSMSVSEAFGAWSGMLSNLGSSYATHERFLRHYYNAFKQDLPEIPNAAVATKSNLIRIYERILSDDTVSRLDALVEASGDYGRITGHAESDAPTDLDTSFTRLTRAQGAPSYVLLLWLMNRRGELDVTDKQLIAITDNLVNFFVRRNLTGYPQTYALPKLFMSIISAIADERADGVVERIRVMLLEHSSSDEEFRARLGGPIYQESSDVTRLILTTLAEDAMTNETAVDLWAQEKGHYRWTIEHVLPQGANLPQGWLDMLGGADQAKDAQESHAHRLGNLTITAYNSTLGNKSFVEKRDRKDSEGRHIGYRNNLSLNEDLKDRQSWGVAAIEARTSDLVDRVVKRFPLQA